MATLVNYKESDARSRGGGEGEGDLLREAVTDRTPGVTQLMKAGLNGLVLIDHLPVIKFLKVSAEGFHFTPFEPRALMELHGFGEQLKGIVQPFGYLALCRNRDSRNRRFVKGPGT